jgi:uncharacterized protein YbjQ (UPF0145 family)
MKVRIATVCAFALLVVSVAHARDERLKMPLKDAMETVEAKDKLGSDIKFFFGSQKSPKATQTLGTFTANKKTNFANKSDQEGCQRAFLSAMITLKERAVREGGNAVVNIHSVYKDAKFESDTEYECGAGKIMGGVALRGTIVKL